MNYCIAVLNRNMMYVLFIQKTLLEQHKMTNTTATTTSSPTTTTITTIAINNNNFNFLKGVNN